MGQLRLFGGCGAAPGPYPGKPTRSWTAHSHLCRATESLERDCWLSLQQPEASRTPYTTQSPRSICLTLFSVPLRRQRQLHLCLVCTLCVYTQQANRWRPQQHRSQAHACAIC